MRPIRALNATRVLAESQDEYYALAIRDEQLEDGTNVMVSIWEPSPKELRALLNGGTVKLSICGVVHPPVMISTQDAPAL